MTNEIYIDTFLWLIGVNAIIWIGIGAYIIYIAIKQRNLSQRLKQMEILQDESDF